MKQRARVLCSYDAKDSTELSLSANEVSVCLYGSSSFVFVHRNQVLRSRNMRFLPNSAGNFPTNKCGTKFKFLRRLQRPSLQYIIEMYCVPLLSKCMQSTAAAFSIKVHLLTCAICYDIHRKYGAHDAYKTGIMSNYIYVNMANPLR